MTKKLCVVTALFCFVLSGCVATGKPMTWEDEEYQFTDQIVFFIKPVQNKTGNTFQEDILSILDAHLKIQFEEEGLTVIDNTNNAQDVLYVESELLVYVEGNAFKRWLAPGAGKTQCTLKSRLIDQSNKLVAEIVAAKEVGAGGLYSVGADKSILKDATSDISAEVAKLVSPQTEVEIKRARPAPTATKSPSKDEDIYTPGDKVLVEFKNGKTIELTLTHINDRFVVGHYNFKDTHSSPRSYDRRGIKRIRLVK